MKELKKLIALAEHKNEIDIKRGEAKYIDSDFLLDSIRDESDHEIWREVKVKQKNRCSK